MPIGRGKLSKNRCLHFVFDQVQSWDCLSTDDGEYLGTVAIFWRQWCFFPHDEAIYSSLCLDDIADFLQQLNDGDQPKES